MKRGVQRVADADGGGVGRAVVHHRQRVGRLAAGHQGGRRSLGDRQVGAGRDGDRLRDRSCSR